MRFLSVVLAVACLASRASAHSWIWCTDYTVANPREPAGAGPNQTDPARRIYDDSLCSGYPPSFPTFINRDDFGRDSGYENRPAFNNDELCVNSRQNSYSADYPQAQYVSGQTVCLAYPAKNHVAAPATNQFIPDNGVRIYRSDINPGNNGFIQGFMGSEFMNNGALTHFNGVHQTNTIDYLGFQNCPDFGGAGGTDQVLCTMCFELGNLPEGEYQFAWFWEFNTNEFYSTCWNAMVRADEGSPTLVTSSEPSRPTTTAQTTTTRVIETMPGQDICDVEGRALCGRGLGRGECILDPQTGDYTCECVDGFENAANPRICNIEGGITFRFTFDVLFSEIQSADDLALSLQLELAMAFTDGDEMATISPERLVVSLGQDSQGFLVALITIQGTNEAGQLSVAAMANQLQDMGTDLHGFMGLATSAECLNCDSLDGGNAAGMVAPSLVVIIGALASTLAQ